MEKNLVFADLTRTIIGSAMKVHTYFGMGLPEIVYKNSLLIELKKAGLNCKAEEARAFIITIG